jgi:hypothetical protein
VGASHREVIGPSIAARMKQQLHAGCKRVDSAEIRPFAQIAVMACQREISGVVRTAMLPRNDVFDVMRDFAMLLVEQAVFATVSRSLANEAPGSGVQF